MGDHLCIGPDVLAVWTGGTDLGPVNSPSSYPTRVRFNSKQENIGFLPTARTGSYTNTVWPAADPDARKIKLFAHGQSYRPFLAGRIIIGGRSLPINGSVLHYVNSQVFYAYSIGADNTDVYLNILRSLPGLPGALPSPATISYEIFLSVYGVNANGSLRRPSYLNGVDVNAGGTPTYVKAGYFDTAYRYPWKDASGNLSIPDGRTISTGIGWNGGVGTGQTNAVGLGWRYSVLGHVVQRNAISLAPLGASVFLGNDSGFNASVTRYSL